MSRIALVTTSLSPFVREHGAAIALRGHKVTLIGPASQVRPGDDVVGSTDSAGQGRREAGQIPIAAFRPWWPNRWPSLVGGDGAPDQLERHPWLWAEVPSIVTAMAGALWRHGRTFDALVAHWLLPAGLLAAVSHPHLPLLAIAHGSDAHLLAALPRPLRRAIMQRLLRPGIRMVATSDGLVEKLTMGLDGRLRRQAEQRCTILPMGIDVAALQAETSMDREEARKRLGLATEGPVALFMGRLVPVKNPLALIDLARRIEDLSILVAGSGPLEPVLRHAATRHAVSHRIHVLGWANQNRKALALRASDLAVLPSIRLTSGRTESSPVVLVEAMAAGLPVVASSVGGIAQTVVPNETGFLVEPNHPTELARAVQSLIHDDVLRRSMSNEARRVARKRDWSMIVSRHLHLLSQAASELGRQ